MVPAGARSDDGRTAGPPTRQTSYTCGEACARTAPDNLLVSVSVSSRSEAPLTGGSAAAAPLPPGGTVHAAIPVFGTVVGATAAPLLGSGFAAPMRISLVDSCSHW
jgi:hypothetical protein